MLARKIEREKVISARPPLIENLMRLAREHGRLTLAASVALTGGKRNTIKAHLGRLVTSGELRLQKYGRSSWYEPS